MVIVCCQINRYYIQFSFVRMETVYRLLYSLIAVQWKAYNMMAQTNLLHFIMDREEVRTRQASANQFYCDPPRTAL